MILFFMVFIITTTFGLMNVIVGVIVDNTMEAAKAVQTGQNAEATRQRLELLSELAQKARQHDKDGSGTLDLKEVKRFMDDLKHGGEVQNWMAIPKASDPEEFRDLMDASGDGKIKTAKFMKQCFRLADADSDERTSMIMQGTHKTLRHVRQLQQQHEVRSAQLEQQLHRLEDAIFAGGPPTGIPRRLSANPSFGP